MSLEVRIIGNRSYVTQTHREEGRVVKRHVGSTDDPIASMAWRTDRLRRAEQAATKQRLKADRKQNERIEDHMKLLVTATQAFRVLRKLTDPSSTYWPKKTHRMSENRVDETSQTVEIESSLARLPKYHALGRLREQANAGDEDAIAEMDRLVQVAPEIVRSMFQPIQATRNMVVTQLAGDDPLQRASIELQIDEQIAGLLASDEGTALDRMRAQVVALAWLDAMRCHVLAMRSYERKSDQNQYQSLADRSHRRFIRAAKSLSQQ